MKLTSLIIIVGALLVSTPGFGKKSKRRGFNFGASFNSNKTSLTTNSSVESGNKINEDIDTSSVKPHIGYVVNENLNIGLAMNMETSITESKEKSPSGEQAYFRKSEVELSGTSLFVRFLFANYMYFEAGAGLYERIVRTTQIDRTNISGGSFLGNESVSNVKGLGTGYHYGAGLEFPISKSGFFFTTSYNVRAYQLRDTSSEVEFGKKAGSSDSKELNFGLTHYLK